MATDFLTETMDVLTKLKPSQKNIQTPTEDGSFEQLSRDFHLDNKLMDSGPVQGHPNLSHSYSLEWENLFTKPDMLNTLKEKAVDGNLRSSRFRSVAWRIFLEVLPPDMGQWIEKTRETRNKYEELKNSLIVNPRKAVDPVNITLNNPLSQDEESPWNKFFQDNELRLTIKQDVIRTYPKIEFFQSNQLRNLMVDILFIFAKENTDISYRQGMHELLAPLIFVLHCDHQAFLHASEIESVLDVMKEVLDPAYLEHDAYTMFCQVMLTVEPWYFSNDMFRFQTKTGSSRSLELINAIPFSKSQDLNPSSIIVTRLTRIHDCILKKTDPELHQHLERLEIVPQIYGIRWLRLLFGREFPMHDLLMLWDAIFGDGIGFSLVDYIFVAMLVYLRDILLTNDYTVCLSVLMKFPPVTDVNYFVAKALWIREPNHYPEPPNYTHQGSIRVGSSVDSSIENIHSFSSDGISRDTRRSYSQHHGQNQKRQNNMLGGFSSFTRKFNRPRTLSVPKSSSEPMNLQTDVSPDFADNPIGSTVSLSHVEESMFRHNPLASSLAQLESSNLRSAQSSPGLHQSAMFPLTPDEFSVTSSPPKYNSLLVDCRNQNSMTNREKELQETVSRLQKELNTKNSMCRYCSSKLDVHIGRLQQDLSRQNIQLDEEMMVSLAGLKLVRDILNGTVTFSQEIADDDEDLQNIDGYHGTQDGAGDNCSSGITSPESDILLNATTYRDDELIFPELSGPSSFSISNKESSSSDLSPETPLESVDTVDRGSNAVELNDLRTQDQNIAMTTSHIQNIAMTASHIQNIGASHVKPPVQKEIGASQATPSVQKDIGFSKSVGKESSSSGFFATKFLSIFKTDSPSSIFKTGSSSGVAKTDSSSGVVKNIPSGGILKSDLPTSVFKADYSIGTHKSNIANNPHSRTAFPATSIQQKQTVGVQPSVLRSADDGHHSRVNIPPARASAPGTIQHHSSKDEQWDRELITLDSRGKAKLNS